jgi:hypothetical protein
VRIRWLQDARLEAAKSAHYYRDKDAELGPAFTAEIRARLAFVKQFPETGFRLPRTKYRSPEKSTQPKSWSRDENVI